MAITTDPILQAKNIVKRFPGVIALKGVSFDLRPGEVHALCGENGAGKSTLIKILSGLHPAGSYEGELRIDGKTVNLSSIGDARALGVSVIYQELSLVGEMSVAENIYLGKEPRRGGLIDWPAVYEGSRKQLERLKIKLDPDTPVRDLGIGQQQLVEIAKALGEGSARILILDEPTAALSDQEVEQLLSIVKDLRAQGIACLYISHKLDEVFSLADRITVLRDGETVTTMEASQTDQADVIRHMVGRELGDLFPRHTPQIGAPLLTVRNLTVARPEDGRVILDNVSFEVRQGEVLGIGGLMGAGRTELLTHLFGAWGKRISGTVELDEVLISGDDPSRSVQAGMALVSEDRKRYGLVLRETIGFNLSLSSLGKVTRNGLIDGDQDFTRNEQVFKSLRVKAPDLDTVVGQLSGGNQQKVVIGKTLLTEPKVIFLDEPTRGIDVGAKVEVYEIINELTAGGRAVVLVSSELPELINMSDRILMLHEGRIAGEFTPETATQEALMHAAMGQTLAKA
jgi:D-xylose transport system ATP-binding protein